MYSKICPILILSLLFFQPIRAAINPDNIKVQKISQDDLMNKIKYPRLRKYFKKNTPVRINKSAPYTPQFDFPITYNREVIKWIKWYQKRGKNWLAKTFSKSHKYFPNIYYSLKKKGLPLDLAYISIIESGLSASAISSAKAVGFWQFMKPTGQQYGLNINWWIDERRDLYLSTNAATNYLGDLYKMFGDWYLAAAAYNMGEGRLKRLIKRHKTRNFWKLSKKRGFPKETREYVPKLIATILIAKAPKIYGLKSLKPLKPYRYEVLKAPGGTDIFKLASRLGVSERKIKDLNPGLIKGFIPGFVKGYRIRVPKGKKSRARALLSRPSKRI